MRTLSYFIVDFRINWTLYSVRLGNRTYRGVLQKCLINCMFYYKCLLLASMLLVFVPHVASTDYKYFSLPDVCPKCAWVKALYMILHIRQIVYI